MVFCINCTLSLEACICDDWPDVDLGNFSIMFHPRERHKRNSTGRLAHRLSRGTGNDPRHSICGHIWHRTMDREPWQTDAKPYLLYPESPQNDSASQSAVSDLNESANLLLIDGTWQQARKMLRQSPWLQALPRVEISLQTKSSFNLRRNQTQDGLATLEAIAYCLFAQGRSQCGQDLLDFLSLFQQRYAHCQAAGLFKK